MSWTGALIAYLVVGLLFARHMLPLSFRTMLRRQEIGIIGPHGRLTRTGRTERDWRSAVAILLATLTWPWFILSAVCGQKSNGRYRVPPPFYP